ncbi:hypothetical protein JCGZ_01686 [Jatropha curcas]|uniref:Uncharacterized protein n=1 Tax=Jatropha curcas TaxID=180498 RepID=A0A067JJL2_JATCU|nr:hypothetical protein JCGZ_01686 [Jatropha curcas]
MTPHLAPSIIITEIKDPLSEIDFSFLNNLSVSSVPSPTQPSYASIKAAKKQLRHLFDLNLPDLSEEQRSHVFSTLDVAIAKVNTAAHQVSKFKKCKEDLLPQVDAFKVEIALLEGEVAAPTTFEECLSKE